MSVNFPGKLREKLCTEWGMTSASECGMMLSSNTGHSE